MKLQVNESTIVSIYSREFWNDTGVEINKYEQYHFEAQGTWKDLILNVDTNGYTNWYISLFNKLKRSKNNKWFALIGSINKKEDFLIGITNQNTFKNEEGNLFCYANDAKGFYWNNSGFISLKITRLI